MNRDIPKETSCLEAVFPGLRNVLRAGHQRISAENLSAYQVMRRWLENNGQLFVYKAFWLFGLFVAAHELGFGEDMVLHCAFQLCFGAAFGQIEFGV